MMNNWLYVVLFIIVVLLWVYSKRSKAKSSKKHFSKASKRKQDFRAISIQICPQACAAAKALRDTRLLAGQAPMLPLADCNVKDCTCKYVHHQDRRSHDDRRFPSFTMKNVFSDKEKREEEKSDRRRK